MDCYLPCRRKPLPHTREVVTTSIGALIQHDALLHLWSPYAQEKWTLITSIDDCSRMILFADFFAGETTWAHIQAAQAVIETFGPPLRYYVDSLHVFRFVQGRDGFWRKHVLQTDEVDTQWSQMMRRLGVDVAYGRRGLPGASRQTSIPASSLRTPVGGPQTRRGDLLARRCERHCGSYSSPASQDSIHILELVFRKLVLILPNWSRQNVAGLAVGASINPASLGRGSCCLISPDS